MASKKAKHKTVPKELKQTIDWLESVKEVKKIVIGITENCRHKRTPGTLKISRKVSGGLKIIAYGGRGVTDLYLNIDPIDKLPNIVNEIENRFS